MVSCLTRAGWERITEGWRARVAARRLSREERIIEMIRIAVEDGVLFHDRIHRMPADELCLLYERLMVRVSVWGDSYGVEDARIIGRLTWARDEVHALLFPGSLS